MNNTKWKELQNAMYSLEQHSPKWRTKCITNGYVSDFDGVWFYHFAVGGFSDIEWVEIQLESEEQRDLVLSKIKRIHVPCIETKIGFKILAYVEKGATIEYL